MRKKKVLLILPLFVVPIFTLGFWALGGGRAQPANELLKPGLNLNLPEAKLKEESPLDKLSFYDKAEQDSLKQEELLKTDPYYHATEELQDMAGTTASKYNQRLNLSPHPEGSVSADQQILQKIALLEKEMSHSTTQYPPSKEILRKDEGDENLDRLQTMLQGMNKADEDDPAMQQLDSTLERILDIQHPERVKEKLKERSALHREKIFPVQTAVKTSTISLLDTQKNWKPVSNGFFGYSQEGEGEGNETAQPAIPAVVLKDQSVVNGAVVQLRLMDALYINGIWIPEGNEVAGIAVLQNERLMIEINSIRSADQLFAVKLELYDMDGLPGIYIPGAITRESAKQSTDNSLQLLELSSIDPSLKAQAAAAGMSAAKNLLSKKVKLVKVMLKAGYKVWLKDKNG